MENVQFKNDDILWLMRIQQQFNKNTSKFHHERFFNNAFQQAALAGDVTRLKVLSNRAHKYFTNKDVVFTTAVKTEQFNFMLEMFQNGYRPKTKVAVKALNKGIANGALSTVSYLLKNTSLTIHNIKKTALITATKMGHSHMINMLSYYKYHGSFPANNYFIRPLKNITPNP